MLRRVVTDPTKTQAVRAFAAQTDDTEHGVTPRKDKIMNNIEYVRVGDYLLPNIKLKPIPAEEKETPLGRYARMRRTFLKEHRPIEYSILLLSEQLFSHLREVDAIAEERMRNGCPESIIVKEIVCES
jgi:hypothetical protein